MRNRCRAASPFRPPLGRLLAAAGLALALAATLPARAESPGAEPRGPVTVESVRVTPAAAGPETLCQLHVVVRNAGPRAVSQLAFRVTLEGAELPAYARRLFMARLDPGESRELRLFNFWTSETGRPAPADGHFELEVALVEARWVDVTREGEVEIWTPGGPVPGLPARVSLGWRPGG